MIDHEESDQNVTNEAILSDVMESVIAALYLDQGLAAARSLIHELWAPLITARKKPPKDAKSRLQEWAQARGNELPTYEVIHQTGPDHAPVFTIRVSLGNTTSAEAEGATKRLAEQAAAAALLQSLMDEA